MSELDELLQHQLEALEAGSAVEIVQAKLPQREEELASLVNLASAIRNISHPEPQSSVSISELTAMQGKPSSLTSLLGGIFDAWRTPQLRVAGLVGMMLVTFFAIMTLLSGGLWLLRLKQAQTVKLINVSGDVAVFSGDQDAYWVSAADGHRLKQGDSLRTPAGSSVTLSFSDGSRVSLTPKTALELIKVKRSFTGEMQVVLDQLSGETSHSVVPLKGENSTYQVHTPSGVASVHGTNFSVVVDRSGGTHVAVDTGKVLVMAQDTEVMLSAGQVTEAHPGKAPDDPAYQFKLEGQVVEISGELWTVNRVVFQVTDETHIEGDPDVESFVEVKGHILPDGTLVADKIEVAPMGELESHITGVLNSMDGDVWYVDGVAIIVDGRTRVDQDIKVGDTVRVTFFVLDDGNWLALRIKSLSDDIPEPTDTLTPSPSPSPSPTATLEDIDETPTVIPALVTDCVGADPQPKGMKLARQFGVSYEEIMGWFCQRFGFGEIEHAYTLSEESGVPVEEIFAMRRSGLGWGQIKAALETSKQNKPDKEPKPNKQPKPTKMPKPTKKPKP